VHVTDYWYHLKRNCRISFLSMKLIFNWDQLEADHIYLHNNASDTTRNNRKNELVDLKQIRTFSKEISKELALHVLHFTNCTYLHDCFRGLNKQYFLHVSIMLQILACESRVCKAQQLNTIHSHSFVRLYCKVFRNYYTPSKLIVSRNFKLTETISMIFHMSWTKSIGFS